VEHVTVGQITTGITLLATFIGSVVAVYKYFCNLLGKQIEESLKPIEQKVDMIVKNMNDMDLNRCKDFLSRFISDLEQGQHVSEIELERFHETYAHYQNICSSPYLHDKVEKLKKQGKL
jgi:hypothetical protein